MVLLLNSTDCSDACTISEPLSDNINGEIFYQHREIVAARNGENMVGSMSSEEQLNREFRQFSDSTIGMGTMPANRGQYWIYKNIQGILQMYESKFILNISPNDYNSKINEATTEEVEVSKASNSLLLFSFFLVFSFTWNQNLRSAFKFSIPLLFIHINSIHAIYCYILVWDELS